MRTSCLLVLMVCVAPSQAEPAKSFETAIFDGKDLDGWVVEGAGNARKAWSVKDGLLVCKGGGYGFLRFDKKLGDFKLHVEYRMQKRGNSGIGIRTPPFDPKRNRQTRPSLAAYEIQLVDDAGRKPNRHSTGSLYRYVAPTSNPVKPAPEWNEMDIECVGPKIRIWLNGTKIMDVDQSKIDAIKKKPLQGYICLQNHGRFIEFRNIRITDYSKNKSE